MGDVPIAYVEGAGGVRVSEDEVVAVGKHDVCIRCYYLETRLLTKHRFSLSELVAKRVLS